jgi:hypothetical protein
VVGLKISLISLVYFRRWRLLSLRSTLSGNGIVTSNFPGKFFPDLRSNDVFISIWLINRKVMKSTRILNSCLKCVSSLLVLTSCFIRFFPLVATSFGFLGSTPRYYTFFTKFILVDLVNDGNTYFWGTMMHHLSLPTFSENMNFKNVVTVKTPCWLYVFLFLQGSVWDYSSYSLAKPIAGI